LFIFSLPAFLFSPPSPTPDRSGPGGSGPGRAGLIQGKSGRFSDGIRYRTVTDPARTNKIFKFRSSGKRVDVGVTYVTYLINEMKTA
jgi:hypothetical protein